MQRDFHGPALVRSQEATHCYRSYTITKRLVCVNTLCAQNCLSSFPPPLFLSSSLFDAILLQELRITSDSSINAVRNLKEFLNGIWYITSFDFITSVYRYGFIEIFISFHIYLIKKSICIHDVFVSPID